MTVHLTALKCSLQGRKFIYLHRPICTLQHKVGARSCLNNGCDCDIARHIRIYNFPPSISLAVTIWTRSNSLVPFFTHRQIPAVRSLSWNSTQFSSLWWIVLLLYPQHSSTPVWVTSRKHRSPLSFSQLNLEQLLIARLETLQAMCYPSWMGVSQRDTKHTQRQSESTAG